MAKNFQIGPFYIGSSPPVPAPRRNPGNNHEPSSEDLSTHQEPPIPQPRTAPRPTPEQSVVNRLVLAIKSKRSALDMPNTLEHKNYVFRKTDKTRANGGSYNYAGAVLAPRWESPEWKIDMNKDLESELDKDQFTDLFLEKPDKVWQVLERGTVEGRVTVSLFPVEPDGYLHLKSERPPESDRARPLQRGRVPKVYDIGATVLPFHHALKSGRV